MREGQKTGGGVGLLKPPPGSYRVKLKFKSFKHSAQTHHTVMTACDSHLKHIFLKYILSRGTRAGPFICYENRESITRTDLVRQLIQDLSDCDLDPSLYNTHSFRIGKATDMYLVDLAIVK